MAVGTKFYTRPMLVAETKLTDTDIKALVTPVTLVPAPGANKAVIVSGILMVFDVTTTAYTEPSAPDDLVIEYSGSTDIVNIEFTGFLDQTSDQIRYIGPAYMNTNTDYNAITAVTALVTPYTPVANTAIDIRNTGGNYTGGNAANTLSIQVEYRIVPTVAFGP